MATPRVLIVGAGPVGLSLALECARRDVPFRLIDSAAEPSTHSKALAIWSAAQEFFSALGVLDRMTGEGLHPAGIRMSNRRRTLLRVPSGEFVDSPYPGPLILPQSATERILAERLVELGHRVERQVELRSLEQDDHSISASLVHADGSMETQRCEYLVGCDGAHSAVRHAVGVKFEGKARPECFILCDAELSGKRMLPQEVFIFLSSRGVLPMFPIRERVWRVISTREAGDGTAPPTIEEMQEHLADRGPRGFTLSNPEWLSCFRISERKVERFRSGRVLLAGDAAHIHSPAGGQGMNTGLQDSLNIGWKLAGILNGGFDPERLLESYHAERSPVAARVIAGASMRTRIATIARSPLAVLRNWIAALAGHSEQAVAKIAVSFSGTGIRYESSPILVPDTKWHEDWHDHGYKPGSKMRDATVYSDGAPISLLREVLASTTHTLIIFSGRRPNYRDADAVASIREQAAGYASLISTWAVWRGEHGPDFSWVLDPEGIAHRRFGAEFLSLCLMRPDGVVAARSQPGDFAVVQEAVRLLRQAA